MNRVWSLLLGCLVIHQVSAHAAGPIISEFMVRNERILADEDGEFPDWVEIHNPEAGPVDLGGWFLTDNAALPAQWAFPAVTVPGGGYLVVFASGKNRTGNPARLHTSFELEATGGYLALVRPDGVTVASAFDYPDTKEDVAYGTAQNRLTSALLGTAAPRILVASAAIDLPADWNQAGFGPGAAWLTGAAPLGVGYDTNRSSSAPVNVARSGTAAQSTTLSGFSPNLALNGNLADFTHTQGTDANPFWQVTLTNEMVIFNVVVFNRTSCCGSRLRDITIEILSTNASGIVTNYRSPLLNAENAGFSYPNGPAYLSNDLVSATGGPVSGRIVRISRSSDPDLSGSGGQGNADEASVLSLGEVAVNAASAAGLRPYFTTDLEANLRGINASAFVRVPFTLATIPDDLSLSLRYDDGFIAFLNGVEVARRNAPADASWNSAATTDRNFAAAIAPETINLSGAISALSVGDNVLAFHALNSSAGNADFLLQPELVATRIVVTPNVYFDNATPGGPNVTGWYLAEVADTQFSVDRGFFEAPFSLTITSATPDAVIYYSVNGDEPGLGKGLRYAGPITITNTTVLRARAFKENWKPTDVDSTTFIFIADVIEQARTWPTGGPPPEFPGHLGRQHGGLRDGSADRDQLHACRMEGGPHADSHPVDRDGDAAPV